MKNILVPIDFSDESINALKTAYAFAKFAGSKLVLLNVIEDPNVNSVHITGEINYDPLENIYTKLFIDKTTEKMEAILSDPNYGDVEMSYKIDIGNTYSSIIEHINTHQASLIIMGSRGASGLQEILLGSVADKVTRHASCPVIVVKEEARLSAIEQIIFATDLKDDQGPVVDELKKIQSLLRAHIHIINIVNNGAGSFDESEKKMLKFVKDHAIENYSLVVEQDDDITDAILDFANEKNAGLIAFGTHDRHGLIHLLTKRVSKNLTNHSKHPIWTLPIN